MLFVAHEAQRQDPSALVDVICPKKLKLSPGFIKSFRFCIPLAAVKTNASAKIGLSSGRALIRLPSRLR